MINKFKDFLKKKLNPKASRDSSDQDEPSYNDDASEVRTNTNISLDDTSATVQMPKDGDPNKYDLSSTTLVKDSPSLINKIKDRFSETFTVVREKLSGAKIPKSSKFKNFKVKLPSKNDAGSLLSPSLTRSIEKFLSRSYRETIHQVGLILLICSFTYTLGKITAMVMRKEPTLDSARDYTVAISLENSFNPGTLNQVKSINIFRTNNPGSGPKVKVADKKCEEAEQQSGLPIKLINTVVLQDVVKSIASVQIRGDRELQEVRVGDQISNLAEIFKITRLEILVKNLESGMCESIANDLMTKEAKSPISVLSPAQSRDFKANKKLSGIDNVGNKFVISKTLLDEKLKDIGKILTQARAVPIKNPDGTLSFKMTELDPSGIFPYLGVQEGDIISSINGKPIYEINEVMLLFGRIKGLDNLSLGIKREGTDTTQEYSIKK